MPVSRSRRAKTKKHTQESSSGGAMMSFRRGMKNIAGTGGGGSKKPSTPLQRAWDVIFWVLLAGAVGFFLYRRFG
jgi:hypothetical protein